MPHAFRSLHGLLAPAALAVALALALGAGAAGCKSHSSLAYQKEAFGEVANADGVDFARYLALARAIVLHKDRPQLAPDGRPAQRVFLTVYSSNAPLVTTALGDSLLAGVVAASEALAAKASGIGESARIKLDVVTAVEAEPETLEGKVRVRASDAGIYGYLFRDAEHTGFVLPTEIVTEGYVESGSLNDGSIRLVREKLVATMAERAGVSAEELPKLAGYRFKTAAYVESTPATGTPRALAVHRALLDRSTTLTADDLLVSVRAGADYLARFLDDDGHYAYMVHPVDEHPDRSYGILRHAGSTYALLEAYGELGGATYRAKAEKALAYMVPRYKTTPDGMYLSDNKDEEQQKVGGNGLALLALAKHMQVTGSRENLDTMRALGRYMVHQQYPDGHFRDNADVTREDPAMAGKKLKKEVSYFAGEAVLGLMRLYAVDPQAQWLEAAKKGADYIVLVRDAKDDETKQIHDHWGAYAMNDLYRATQNPAYADHAFKIARAVPIQKYSIRP